MSSMSRTVLGLFVLSVVACFDGANAEPEPAGERLGGGGLIVFSRSTGAGRAPEVYTVRPDGSALERRVTSQVSGRGESEPHPSPDGKRIAFTTYRYGGWKIAIAGLDGADVRRLTADPHYAYDAAWSPDGRRLVYRRIETDGPPYFDGYAEIYVIDADGTNNRRVTRHEGHKRNATFSPDGKRILFDSFDDQYELYVVGVDGSSLTNLTASKGHEFAPSWSPDGKRIAYQTVDAGDHLDLWVMNADGSDGRRLTDYAKQGLKSSDKLQHWQLNTSWSPDGKWIAFVSDAEGNPEIYLAAADGSRVVRLTDDPASDTHPHWFKP